MDTVGTWWMWAGFALFVVAAVVVDLIAVGRQGAHRVTLREALNWSVLWVALALAFNALLWMYLDGSAGRTVANQKAIEFFTGYVIEKSLAVDNIFVFLMIFTFFAVPAEFQKRALIIGVIGAIVLRAIMILVGAWLISQFHWILYVFGGFLVITGIKMLWAADQPMDLAGNPLLRWMRGHLRISDGYDGERLLIRKNGALYATPLFLVLALIGFTDVVFAVDSIPAIFAITEDPFIVLTSNIFAILGLRAMYFLLADMANRFHLLSYGLAIVLMFVGTKMLVVDFVEIPVFASLGVVVAILAATIVLSVLTRTPATRAKESPARAD